MFWLAIVAAVCVFAALALVVGVRNETSKREELLASLARSRHGGRSIDTDGSRALPAPVRRYLQHVLGDGQRLIARATLRQTGRLRTDTERDRWMAFTATHVAAPMHPGFVWDASVRIPLAHVRVVDGFVDGYVFRLLGKLVGTSTAR